MLAKQAKSFWCCILTEVNSKDEKPAVDKDIPMPVTRLRTTNHQQSNLVVEAVPFLDIITITDTTLRVDVEAILKKNVQAMTKARNDLIRYADEVEDHQQGLVVEFNWGKIKDLEFRENLAQKHALFARILECQCNKCPDLKPHVCFLILLTNPPPVICDTSAEET